MKNSNIPKEIRKLANDLLPDRARHKRREPLDPTKQIRSIADNLVPKRARKVRTTSKVEEKALKKKKAAAKKGK